VVSVRAAIAAAIVAFAPVWAAPLPPEACVRLLRDARIEADAGRREQALALARRAVEQFPAETVPVVALLQLSRNGPPEALAAVREQLRVRLFDPAAALPVAAIRYLGEDPHATADEIALLRDAVNAALTKAPDDAKLLEAAYRLAERTRDTAAAVAIVDRQIAAAARPELLWRRLELCAALERWGDVAVSARAILAAQPASDPARQYLVQSLTSDGRLDEARAELDTLLKSPSMQGRLATVYLVPLAWAYWDAGRDADAKALFAKALAADPSQTDLKATVDLLLATPEQRLAAGAKSDDRWAKEKDSGALLEEGTKRLAAGDAASAFDLLSRAAAAGPADDVLNYNLAMAAIKLERWSDAETALKSSIAQRPDRGQAYLQLGRVLQAQGKCESALQQLDRALELRSDLNEAHFYRYKCLEKLGRTAEAAHEAEVYKAGKASKGTP
jgi:tetratricopeptide (TPR) repeat protein